MAEKEYIERGAFVERLKDFSEWCRDGRKQGVDFVLDCSLPNMPAADVVEVVRCKDCSLYYPFTENTGHCWYHKSIQRSEDFCSHCPEGKQNDR